MAVKAAAQETVFDLTDAYSIMLTSESYTFNGNTSGVPAGKSCSTQVVSYLGGTPKKSNISKVTCPVGISVAIKENNTVAPTLTFTTTSTITSDCEAVITVSVDDVTINKKFSFGIAKAGTNGQNGSPGRGIKSTEITYQIWKDGTSTPNGTWSSTPPKTTADNPYLWTRIVITYTDDTKSTSYSVGSTPEGIVVGGRNLLLKSKDCNDNNYYYGIGYVNSGSQFKNCNIFKVSSAWSGIKPWFTKHVTDRDVVKAGDVLTYSIYARTDNSKQMRIILFNRRQDTNNGQKDLSTSVFELTSEWQRYSVTFTVTEGMLSKETGITYFGFVVDKISEDGKFVYFSCPKLELGNIATDWTPAPEDVDEGINNAQSSADKANSNANNAQNSANNAQDTANKADAKADQAKADSAAASTAAQIAKKQADEAQAKSDEANRIANGAVATISPIAQVVKIDQHGLKILNSENQTSYAQVQSTGLFVSVNNVQRAVFGATSEVENLAVQDYLMFGAHRAEMKIEDGEEGTAFFHVGDIK